MIEFTIRLEDNLNETLQQLANSRSRSKNEQVVFILKHALKDYGKFLQCTDAIVLPGEPLNMDTDI